MMDQKTRGGGLVLAYVALVAHIALGAQIVQYLAER